MEPTTLEQNIIALTNYQAMEAAQFFAKKLRIEPGTDPDPKDLLAPITDRPNQHLREYGDLAKVLLLYGAQEEAYQEDVQKAIDGVSQKQSIITDQNIVPLALTALGALYVIFRFTHPNVKVKEEKDKKNGKKKKEMEVSYPIDPFVKELVATIKKYFS